MRWVVIVTGSRRLAGAEAFDLIRSDLQVYRGAEHIIVLHGAQEGADLMARDAARALGFDELGIPYFGHRGKAGGPARNRCVVDVGVTFRKHDYGLRLHGYPDAESVGTHQCIAYAKSHGVEHKVTKL